MERLFLVAVAIHAPLALSATVRKHSLLLLPVGVAIVGELPKCLLAITVVSMHRWFDVFMM